MGDFRVRNWTKYQHYKDRKPPWIKLYQGLLTSEDWVAADDATRVLLVACLLVAAQNEGRIPDNPRHLQRVAYLNGPVDFGPLVDSGFLVPPEGWARPDASEMLASCKHDASTMLAPELREQIQIQRKTSNGSNRVLGVLGDSVPPVDDAKRTGRRLATAARTRENDGSFDVFWKRYPRKTNKSDARKAWRKIDPDDATVAAILAAVEQDAASADWRDSGGRFVPYPATWLNGRRWEDEIGADRKPRAGREAEAATAKAGEKPGAWARPYVEAWAKRLIPPVPDSGTIAGLCERAGKGFGWHPMREEVLKRCLAPSGSADELQAMIESEAAGLENSMEETGT